MEPSFGVGLDGRRPLSRMTAAVCGDPVVGQALVLLLRDHRFDVRFLSATDLDEPGALSDVGVLLLAPISNLSGVDRDRLLAAFRHAHEIRSRFTVLDLARLCGVLPGAYEEIVDRWAR